jgi:DNA-binding SARP family transcriptional activator/tetratricopeptide (TPR) repeat protein
MPGTVTTPWSICQLYLFGPLRIVTARESAELPGPTVQRLVGYLALHPRTGHRREALADVLWPDLPADIGRRRLSDTVYRLRSRVDVRWIDSDGDSIALRGDGALWVDVWEFDRLSVAGSRAELEQAVALHSGELLPGVYEDWALGHRMSRRTALVAALERLVRAQELEGDLPRALTEARRLIVTEPLHESAHQTYLRLLGRLRRHGEAAAHLEQMRNRFASELGVTPLPETIRIVEQMLVERDAVTEVGGRSAFVGRSAERRRALGRLDDACDGHGSIVSIEGVAGIGKTRLLAEVIAGARWRGALTLIGDVRDVPEATPLGPLERAVAPCLTGPSLASIEARLDPSMRAALGQLHPAWAADVTPASSADLERSGVRLTNAARAFGRAVAGAGPVVFALDDVHRASGDLWAAVAAFVDGLVAEGGLAVVTYRRPEIESTAGWRHLRAWDRADLLAAIQLAPFNVAEVAELIPSGDVDPEDVLAITGGVPFWVAQWAAGTDAPNDRLALIRLRLDALPPATRAALDGAAVLGERVPFAVWADVVGCSAMELAAAGEHLAQGRWMEPSAAGYAFAHDLIRTAVYDQIDTSSRRALHIRAAASLAGRQPDNARTRAYHLDRAGHAVEASDMYCRAGHHYLAMSAVLEAVDVFARALELQPAAAGRSKLELALTLAKACESVNDYDRQRPALTVARELAGVLGDVEAMLRVALIGGLAASRRGEAKESARLLSEAGHLADRLGDRRGAMDATFLLADLRAQQGKWRAAESAWRSVLAYAREIGDLALEGRVLRGLAIAAKQMGDLESAVRLSEQAVDLLHRSNDRVNELYTSNNLLGVLYDMQAWDRLLDHAEKMLPLAELFGDPVTVGVVRHQQGLAALALGDPGTARTMMGFAKDAFAAAQRPRMVGLVVNTIGLVADDEGDLDEAERLYRSALDTASRIDAATEMAYARHDLGALLVRTGRAGEAIPLLRAAAAAWAEQGNALLQAKSEAHLGLAVLANGEGPDEAGALADRGITLARSGPPEGEQPQGWLWALAGLLDRLGRLHEASDVLAMARAELDRQARGISDPDLRRQFFERVPVNRAILTARQEETEPEATVVVGLARRGAPLGRRLSDDERVCVRWTVHAPADAAIAGKSDRRRHRLVRLLDEAAAAGGAPTDGDLAAALGVSRRTILRDIALLSTDAPVMATRRRSRTQPADRRREPRGEHGGSSVQ